MGAAGSRDKQRNFPEIAGFLKFVRLSINTQISRHPSVWRLRDEQTVLSEGQERHLMGVAADDEHAKVIGWNFPFGGPSWFEAAATGAWLLPAVAGSTSLGRAGMTDHPNDRSPAYVGTQMPWTQKSSSR